MLIFHFNIWFLKSQPFRRKKLANRNKDFFPPQNKVQRQQEYKASTRSWPCEELRDKTCNKCEGYDSILQSLIFAIQNDNKS